MPVTVNWDNDTRTVLCFRITGHWTWQEFHWAWLESVAMLYSVPHTVNTIVDVTQMVNMPLDLVTRSLNLVRSQPQNWGMSFISTNNSFLTFMFNSFKSIAPHESLRLQLVPNVEVARQYLEEPVH